MSYLASFLTKQAVSFVVVAAEEIKFTHEMRGYHHGQSDMRLVASLDGKTVGTLDYVVYDDEPSISYIHVDPDYRRRGIGTKLLKSLQREYPETPIKSSGLTPDGAALRRSIPMLRSPVKEKTVLREELAKIQSKLKEYEKLAQTYRNSTNKSEAAYEAFCKATEDWNELSDRAEEIQDKLESLPDERLLISTASC